MKHQIPDWVMDLINLSPFLAAGAIVIFAYVRFKRGHRPKEWSIKRLALNLLLLAVAGLVLVVALNLMQSARH
jgi:hypothetical protein